MENRNSGIRVYWYKSVAAEKNKSLIVKSVNSFVPYTICLYQNLKRIREI